MDLSIIKKRDGNKRIIITLFAVIMGLLSMVSPDQLQSIAAFIIVLSPFVDPFLTLCLYLCTIVMNIKFEGFLNGGLEVYTGLVAIYIILSNRRLYKAYKTYFQAFIIFILIMIFSFLFGTKSSLMSMITQVYNIIISTALMFYVANNKDSLTRTSLLMSGIIVILLVFVALRSGAEMEFDPITGRLKYGDHVRSLANALAFPIFFGTCRFMDAIAQKGVVKNIYWVTIALLCSYFLLLTMSRGVIIAVVVALFVVYFSRMQSSSVITKILLIIALIGVIYFVQSIEFNEDYLFNKLDTLTGRDVIWEFYWNKMQDLGIITVLFGFGPGEVQRMSIGSAFDGYYAHSVYAGFLFAYGVFGLLLLLYILMRIGRSLWKNRDIESFGFFVLTVLLFFPYGSQGTSLFYYYLGLCISKTFINNQYIIKT